jgi:hypothetical protein
MTIAIGTRIAYMWDSYQITVEIEAADHPVMIVVITLPIGVLELIGSVTRSGRVLHIDRAHVQGLAPGAIGRAGLNAIGRKLLEEADVDEIVIQGGARTTGRNKGRLPRPIRFPHG